MTCSHNQSDYLVCKNNYFSISHCYNNTVPGYLIVEPTINVSSVDGLNAAYLQYLGTSLACAIQLIKTIVRPIKIYCAQFGEEDANLHFHVFPRTSGITRQYLKTYPGQHQNIHGPILLDWARRVFRCSSNRIDNEVSSVIAKMRKLVNTDPRIFSFAFKPATTPGQEQD